MKPAVMHPLAEQELDEVTDYYAAIDVDLADAFVDCVESYKNRMTPHPLHFSRSRGVVHRANLTPQFGEYYLPFMIWKDRVVILAVAHAKRRPYYWRKRIGEAKDLF
jgi:plasmid stabilization system protein ParE